MRELNWACLVRGSHRPTGPEKGADTARLFSQSECRGWTSPLPALLVVLRVRHPTYPLWPDRVVSAGGFVA